MNRITDWSTASLVFVAAALAWMCCTASALAGNAARLMPKVKERLVKLHPDLKFPE